MRLHYHLLQLPRTFVALSKSAMVSSLLRLPARFGKVFSFHNIATNRVSRRLIADIYCIPISHLLWWPSTAVPLWHNLQSRDIPKAWKAGVALPFRTYPHLHLPDKNLRDQTLG